MSKGFSRLLRTVHANEFDDLCRCLALGGGMKSNIADCDSVPARPNTDKRYVTLKYGWGPVVRTEVVRHTAKGTWVLFEEIQEFLTSRGWSQVRDSFYEPPGPPAGCKLCERYLVCLLEGRKIDIGHLEAGRG